ncbi:MAG TPA: M20 family metallopeptidase [Gammaproteobacteria bacterium]|nr:M20 family metallopeptidase [Gammaproteobacteria bacterium]
MSLQIETLVNQTWDNAIIPGLFKYIEIPCKSPLFDAEWEKNGFIDKAMRLVVDWCRQQNIRGLQLTVHRLPGRTPLLVLEVPSDLPQTVLLYGHLDKQPEMSGWHEGLGPWTPVIQESRLYGRGGADDGYAVFASIAAIKALQEQGLTHPRCVIVIEASEESGSVDLPYYMEHIAEQVGTPDLIIGLDSGMGNYEQFWSTTSLRGIVAGTLTVEILTEGVHSGAASGVVPSSFRLIRQLLSRIEDENTGEILLSEFKADIPLQRIEEAKQVAAVLGEKVHTDYPWIEGAKASAIASHQLILNRTWRSALSITGVDGIPDLKNAGNVLRPKTALMLSMRVPPTTDPKQAGLALKKVLEADPPHGAKVVFDFTKASPGWNAPAVAPWLADAIDTASHQYFGKPALFWGEGGSIPFMHMLGEKFPKAQFVITGVLGPHSNAHGPNEFLHIPAAKKLTCCVADLLHQADRIWRAS